MPSQFPLQLMLAWVSFFCCGVGHFYHEQELRNNTSEPTMLLRAVEISQLLWLIVGVAILIYYFIVTHWYWSLVLAFGGSILGALAAGMLFSTVGEEWVSTRGFIAWPILATYAVLTIHNLPS